MIIKLMNNKDELNVVNKKPSLLVEVDGTMRNDTDFLNPVITINMDENVTWDEVIEKMNYLHIPKLNRYYYITDVKALNRFLYEITAHVDVLKSFNSEIKNNSAIIRKQQSKYNLYLNDGTFRTYQDPVITGKQFPSGFSGEHFVMAIAGGN